MTGKQIRKLREGLNMTTHAFADVLGVSVASLYRWEAKNGQASIDPFQQKVLNQLAVKTADMPPEEQHAFGKKIVDHLIAEGSLVALEKLLTGIV